MLHSVSRHQWSNINLSQIVGPILTTQLTLLCTKSIYSSNTCCICNHLSLVEICTLAIFEAFVWVRAGLELGDANARAVELANSVDVVARSISSSDDQVGGPNDRERLAIQAECGHDLRQILLKELLLEVSELGLIGAVEGVRRASAPM